MTDLTASVELIQHQTERLAQLERALDQTLLQVEEARSQLVRQEWIEHQLAATEEFANVQQQAIHHLKGRLDEDDPPAEPTALATPIATPSERLEVRYVQAQQQIQQVLLLRRLRAETGQQRVMVQQQLVQLLADTIPIKHSKLIPLCLVNRDIAVKLGHVSQGVDGASPHP